MGAVAGRGNSVLRGGKVRRGGQDFKPTVAWRKPVKLSGKWVGEFRWEDLVAPGKGWGLRWQQAEQSVDVSLFNRKTLTQNHDIPCPSGLSDPKRQLSASKNVVIARVF